MIPLKFDKSEGLNILCLGAHCDDIEIGCGGTLLKLFETYPIKEVKWVVFASNEQRKKEAVKSAQHFLASVEQKEIIVHSYRDAFLPHAALEIKEDFEAIKRTFNPDIVFTHYRNDRHQDHRLLSDLSWNTFRNHLILEYEIPKYDGDLGQPNCFVKLNEALVKKKVAIIMAAYASQAQKHWFDEETFKSILRIRGMESANQDRYSEAFYLRKLIL